jgi:3-oxoacyl-[acyl-carrier protein] reductase
MSDAPADAAAPAPSPSFDFSGQTVIVTGAARGIGQACSAAFAAAGATVFMVDLDREEVEEAAAEIGGRPAVADVASTEDVERVVAAAVEETGRIDVLFNNAGMLVDKVLWKLTDEDWSRVMEVSLGGTFRFTRACVPHMRERGYGRIVNVTSYTGLHGQIGQANYAAAKAGVIGFTRTAAKELARFGVTVNAISPSAHSRLSATIPAAEMARLESIIPMGRFGEIAEIVPGVLFLASPDAGFVTGVCLPLDGGISI